MPPKDTVAQLEALRTLLELLQKKEPVPDTLYAEAGVKPKARIKDVEKEITSVKKKVSAVKKKEIKEEEEAELEEEAAAKGMTLEEYKEFLEDQKLQKRVNGRVGDFAEAQKRVEMDRADARKKKENMIDGEAFEP